MMPIGPGHTEDRGNVSLRHSFSSEGLPYNELSGASEKSRWFDNSTFRSAYSDSLQDKAAMASVDCFPTTKGFKLCLEGQTFTSLLKLVTLKLTLEKCLNEQYL